MCGGADGFLPRVGGGTAPRTGGLQQRHPRRRRRYGVALQAQLRLAGHPQQRLRRRREGHSVGAAQPHQGEHDVRPRRAAQHTGRQMAPLAPPRDIPHAGARDGEVPRLPGQGVHLALRDALRRTRARRRGIDRVEKTART